MMLDVGRTTGSMGSTGLAHRLWATSARGKWWAVPTLLLAATLCAQEPQTKQPNPGGQAAAAAADAKRVTVTAEGYNRDDALKRALRKAIEQGAGVEISAHSQAENFALIRDTIYSRAFGLVSEYKIVKEGPGSGGTFEITIEAVVSPSAIAKTWGEVQSLLDQLGRPKIMVWIDERIDGQPQDDSIVASRIEEMFVKSGFDMVAKTAIDDIRRRERGDALNEQNAAKLAALAKDAGAQILIRGSANASRAGVRDLYGVRAAFYNCDVQARMYYADTGKLLASESLPTTEAGVRSQHEFSPQAARAALVKATFPESESRAAAPPLAVRIYETVMAQWSTQLTAGGDVELEIEGLDFKAYVNLKKAFADVMNLDNVNGDFTKGIAKFRIKTDLSAETLAERLTDKPFSDWIEIVDLKLGRIQAKAVTRP